MTEQPTASFAAGNGCIPERLDRDTLEQIRELAKLCERHEGLKLKLHASMLESRSPGARRDFLWKNTEGRLIGYLGLNSFEPDSAEVVGLVHPDRRCEGIFSELFRTAEREARSQGITRLILICPENSQSGKGYIKSLGIERSFSEYVMRWSEEDDRSAARQEGGEREDEQERIPSVSLRLCGAADKELVVMLDMLGFDMPRDAAEPFADRVLANGPEDRVFAAFLENGEPAGKICIQSKEGAVYLFGFSVLPEHRGKGFGRTILREAIRLARSEGCESLGLEVECENRGALGLYHSCGFRETAVQDYYHFDVQESEIRS